MALFNGESVYPLLAQFMPIGRAGMGAGNQTIPPLGATEGALWYNFTLKTFQAIINGVVVNLIASGGSGLAGGSNTQVQFNDSGNFGGNANFTFTKGTSAVSLVGSETITSTANGTTALSVSPFSSAFTAPVALISSGAVIGSDFPLLKLSLNASSGGILSLNTSDNTNNVQAISFFNSNRASATASVKALNTGALDFVVTDTGVLDDFRLGGGAFSYKGNTNAIVSFLNNTNSTGLQLNVSPGIITQYGGTNTVAQGVPSLVAKSSLTGQTAAIPVTTIYAVPAGKTGLYRLTYRAAITTAAGTSSNLGGTLGCQVVYTDLNDSVQKTSNPSVAVRSVQNFTSSSIGGTLTANCAASTNLMFSMDYTSSGAPVMAYDFDIYVEYLG